MAHTHDGGHFTASAVIVEDAMASARTFTETGMLRCEKTWKKRTEGLRSRSSNRDSSIISRRVRKWSRSSCPQIDAREKRESDTITGQRAPGCKRRYWHILRRSSRIASSSAVSLFTGHVVTGKRNPLAQSTIAAKAAPELRSQDPSVPPMRAFGGREGGGLVCPTKAREVSTQGKKRHASHNTRERRT